MTLLEVATAAWLVGSRFEWGMRYDPISPTRKSAARRADQGARIGQIFWVEVELDVLPAPTAANNFNQKAVWDVAYPHRLPQGYQAGDPLPGMGLVKAFPITAGPLTDEAFAAWIAKLPENR